MKRRANFKFDDNIKKMIQKKYPTGFFQFERYQINSTNHIELREPFLQIKGDTDKLPLLVSFFREIAANFNKEWLIIAEESQTKSTFYHPCNPRMGTLLSWLKEIKNLDSSFLFENYSIFDRELFVDTTNGIEIIVEAASIEFCRMNSLEDVVVFNENQSALRNELKQVQEHMLTIALSYDKNAHFSMEQKNFTIHSHPFVFLVKKLQEGWKVFYYKKFNTDCIFTINSLSEFKDDLGRMTDKYAREERFFEILS